MMIFVTDINTEAKNTVGMNQVHSSHVTLVGKKDVGSVIDNCDALITNNPEVYLRVSVADCIPLALFDPVTKSIGIVHAGWRGLGKKIIAKTINLMTLKFSVDPKNLHAEIGPHICRRHYEVKKDVASKFKRHSKALERNNGKVYLDLAEVAKNQLTECGLRLCNIEINKKCTFEDTSLPSYRRHDYKNKIYYILKILQSP